MPEQEVKETAQDDKTVDLNKEENFDDLSDDEIEKILKGEESAGSTTDEDEASKDPEASKESESADDDDSKGDEEGDVKPEDLEEKSTDELRAMVLESRKLQNETMREIRRIETQLQKSNQALKEAGLIDEEESEATQEAEKQRQDYLGELEEFMRLSPKYPDYDETVTPEAQEALFQVMAKSLHEEYGGQYSLRDCRFAVEDSVYDQRNPYRFMYDSIKKLQDAAKLDASPEEKTETKEKKGIPELKEAPKKASTGPTSIHGAGPGDEGTKFSASRLDDMSYEELEKVPEAVREKWLSGQLD